MTRTIFLLAATGLHVPELDGGKASEEAQPAPD